MRKPLSMVELRTQGAVLQRHEYSCGAAALATLMGLFGKPATELAVLKSIFGKNLPKTRGPGGREVLRALTLADLEKGARVRGFKVVSLQVKHARDFEAVLRSLQPAIARMSIYKEYHHFVVLHGIADDWVLISDPAYGKVRMPKQQLFDTWEAGERVLLAIGTKPFEAWRTREDRVFLRRPDADRVPLKNSPGPMELFRAIHQRLPQVTTLIR